MSVKMHFNHMLFTSTVAIVAGLVFLSYPGGPIALINLAFWALQLIVTIFALAYTLSEAVASFKAGSKARGILFLALGIVATATVWLLSSGVIYLVIALFLLFTGLVEILGAVQLENGRFFLALLGVINIMMSAVMLKYPLILPLFLAWYVLFWGVSRFFLALEIRRLKS